MAIGHGGQVLVSDVAQELAVDRLPEGCSLRDLGVHRLRDVSRPMRVFQLVHDSLVSDFPALLSRREGTVPVQQTSLIGRDEEAQAVARLLLRPDVRLVSLIGPGGVGKTRLGIRAAEELMDSFVDGVVWVSLASVFDPRVVPSAIAQMVGAHIEPDRAAEETLIDALRTRDLLLVLDNFEQVVAAAPLVSTLVANCPKLKVLLTTRRALRVAGEREFPVVPLEIPNPLTPVGNLDEVAAVRLFVDRARCVKPAFKVDAANAREVVEICRRLDGLPLAIELAAARIRVLTPRAILARLAHNLSLVGGTVADVPQRQQTLRATIDWSYQLLDEQERVFLRRLGVFRGGWTLEAAATVVGDVGLELVDAHESLASKSLIRPVEGDGEPRFLLLETIRDFCLEQLDSAGEAAEVRSRHGQFFTSMLFLAYNEIHGPKQVAWIEQLETELDNIRAARAWAYEQAKHGDVTALTGGLLLTVLGWWHTHIRGYHAELLAAIEEFLRLRDSPSVPDLARGPALTIAGFACYFIGMHHQALAYCEAAVDLLKDDPLTLAVAKMVIAQCQLYMGDVEATQRAYAEMRSMLAPLEKDRLEDLNTDWTLTWSVMFTATTEIAAGNLAVVPSMVEDCRVRFGSMGDIHGRAWATYAIATLALIDGNIGRASQGYAEALANFRDMGDRPNEAMVLEGFGDIAVSVGAFDEALDSFNGAIDAYREMGSRRGQGMALEGVATLAYRIGELDKAFLLAGAARTARGTTGMAIELFPRMRPLLDQMTQIVANDPARKAIFDEGRGMPLDEAIALARSVSAREPESIA